MAERQDWTRHLLLGAALLAAAWAFVFLRQRRREARPVYLTPTPACGDAEPATAPQTAGPFFKANTPKRTSLIEPGIEGERVILEGYVMCQGGAGRLPVRASSCGMPTGAVTTACSATGCAATRTPMRPAAIASRPSCPAATGCARAITTSRCRRRVGRL